MACGRLVRDHKTIADCRKENGGTIRKACARFVMLCRRLALFSRVPLMARIGNRALRANVMMRARLAAMSAFDTTYSASALPLSASKAGAMSCGCQTSSRAASSPSARAVVLTLSASSTGSA